MRSPSAIAFRSSRSSAARARTSSPRLTVLGSPPVRASSSSAWRKKRCGPSKRTNGRAAATRRCSTSRANRSPSITTISTSRTVTGARPFYLRRDRIRFESLDNGFLSCADAAALQAACDALGPADVQAVFDRWSHCLPWPMTPAERVAGYDHRLAICQLEVSLTQVFDRPVQGRHFFEAVIRDNLDLGRPDRVRLLFPLRLTRATPPPAFGYRTRVITDGVEPSLHVEYKSSHVKQYFKEQHALRTETTINNPMDFYVRKAVDNLSYLRELGHQVNRKLLEVERVSHHCVLSQEALDRLQRPTVEDGQRVSALRFGDPRVMALFQALCAFTHLPHGFRNHDLRPAVEALLGRPYTSAQMTYDLRRLRLKGLIHRIPKTHRYTATTYGLKVAFFYAKLYLRILRPNWAALIPADDVLPRSLRAALDQLDAEIQILHEEAAIAA